VVDYVTMLKDELGFLEMTTCFSHRRELLKAKIADLSSMGYLENHGSARDRFETSSVLVLKPLRFPTQIHIAFVICLFVMVSGSTARRRRPTLDRP
jgi:hypothetical protein